MWARYQGIYLVGSWELLECSATSISLDIQTDEIRAWCDQIFHGRAGIFWRYIITTPVS